MSFASVDTGSTGSGLQGPWVSFHLRDGKHRAGTFSIRRKKDKGSPAEVAEFTGFQAAIMIDGDTLKTGWIKRQMGEFPERHWNANIARFEDAPTNEKNNFGKSVWARSAAGVRHRSRQRVRRSIRLTKAGRLGRETGRYAGFVKELDGAAAGGLRQTCRWHGGDKAAVRA